MTHPINGWLVIDKPVGMSSAQIVGKVKWLLKNSKNTAMSLANGVPSEDGEAAARGTIKKFKIGHAGTLDPLATGVLPLAIGEATKIVQFLTDANKRYEFEVTWGEERDTDDAEGLTTRMSDAKYQMSEILNIMEDFKGEIEQTPPQYSAVKLGGKKAYDIARSGEQADIKPRKVNIYDLQITNHQPPVTSFTTHCSKGTYIRSLARDMGRKLGCYGYVSNLHRGSHGKFKIEDAISLEKLEDLCKKGNEQSVIRPVDEILDDIPELKLSKEEAQQVRDGIVLNKNIADERIIRLYHDTTLIAIAEISSGKLKVKRGFNLF